MEGQSLVAMATSPCSLSRSLSLLAPRLASSLPASTFFSPFPARRHPIRSFILENCRLRPCARFSQDYGTDNREYDSGPAPSRFPQDHGSDNRQYDSGPPSRFSQDYGSDNRQYDSGSPSRFSQDYGTDNRQYDTGPVPSRFSQDYGTENRQYDTGPASSRFSHDYGTEYGQYDSASSPDAVPAGPVEPRASFYEVVKGSDKPQSVMLKFVWLERSLGLALDHIIPGYGVIPLTQYYFYPEKDVLKELKNNIESQRWISPDRTVAIMKQGEELIDLWKGTAKS